MNQPPNENRTEAIMVRLSPQELAIIENGMRKTGLNRAQYLRFYALQAATAAQRATSETSAAR
jgi:hypothetical protein